MYAVGGVGLEGKRGGFGAGKCWSPPLAVYLALGSSRLDRKIDIMQINYKAEKLAEKLSACRSVWGALPRGRGYGIPYKCDHHSSKSL